jgi:uncharacterized protein (TIGR03067 family)
MHFQCLLAAALLLAVVQPMKSEDAKEGDLQGTWLPTSAELGGRAFPEEVRKTIRLEMAGNQYTAIVGKSVDKGDLKLDPSAKPKALDITGTEGPNKGKTILAIYERTGDTLRICYDLSGKNRPKEFASAEGSLEFLVTYQREKK